jgi:hypothetical protein
MATLGNELLAQGYAVLAIKADQLNGAINTIEDLQRDLHLELHPSDTIHAIASKERIVILIDQLDAVSELLDRKSQRLNLLLSLIQRLAGSKNVHIVATCREFEFRYGSQFARLAEIEQLVLNLPAWEDISPILEALGHQPSSMGEPLRELLQNPLHLNVFLDVAQPGDVFASSQKLLDHLWEERVKKQPEAEKCVAFVWVDILTRMPPLLNSDRVQATELFDTVIRNCPEVLQYRWALYFISRTLGWFEPKETVQDWLEMLRSNHSNFSQQAYGELLLVQYLKYQDEWSVEQIRHHLANQDNEAILCGLSHAASHLWVQRRCRAIAAEILYTLASSSATSVQQAVASVFRWSRDHFQLNSGMLKIIQAVCKNQGVLLEAANDLTEIIESEELVDNNPEIVAEVCKSLLNIGVELTNPARATAFIAESLTTIAIKLHRQPSSREVGLQIFEQLLTLNLRETQSALEMLDRRPTRLGYYVALRRRLRKRRLPSS